MKIDVQPTTGTTREIQWDASIDAARAGVATAAAATDSRQTPTGRAESETGNIEIVVAGSKVTLLGRVGPWPRWAAAQEAARVAAAAAAAGVVVSDPIVDTCA